SWEIIDSGQDSQTGVGPQLTDSLRLFLQETSAFKKQNPGKFCLLVCSVCTFFAVLGRYIPGIVISYILVLGVFLWPLISSHDISSWLEPVLQKLDFGIGEFFQKIKENHGKHHLDSTVCKEMSVSDTEVSDVTWTDNGTFNLSEGHTPQTENSEDFDREEPFIGGLPEFPSLDNGVTTNGDDDDDLSLGLASPPTRLQDPIKSKHEPQDQSTNALDLVNQMAGEVITAAVTAAIQERIEAAVSFMTPTEDPNEVEDFELLDQSELEQLEGELGLGEKAKAKEEVQTDNPASSGFLSKLLKRH
uniref:Reticulophagy regulator 1 n=1 Tax=Neolamprologus brichardi TaxID=32507 RepID=A0A3Q4G458_NEOBR